MHFYISHVIQYLFTRTLKETPSNISIVSIFIERATLNTPFLKPPLLLALKSRFCLFSMLNMSDYSEMLPKLSTGEVWCKNLVKLTNTKWILPFIYQNQNILKLNNSSRNNDDVYLLTTKWVKKMFQTNQFLSCTEIIRRKMNLSSIICSAVAERDHKSKRTPQHAQKRIINHITQRSFNNTRISE